MPLFEVLILLKRVQQRGLWREFIVSGAFSPGLELSVTCRSHDFSSHVGLIAVKIPLRFV